MAKSKGMPLVAALAAVLVVSYTVFRLNYAANNLPYDPGDPLPAVEVRVHSAAERTARIRETILSRHSVRVVDERTGKSGDATDTTATQAKVLEANILQVWPLRGLELERAIRYLDERITAARNRPVEQRDANSSLQLATLVASRKLVDQDRAFVLETFAPKKGTEPPTSTAGWHTRQMLLFETPGRQRLLYTAINEAEFDFVKHATTADPKTFNPR
tara:strand:- start:54890 stop:55540 length:651 start_codon:yes stop_codon:yes gene_type:complete